MTIIEGSQLFSGGNTFGIQPFQTEEAFRKMSILTDLLIRGEIVKKL